MKTVSALQNVFALPGSEALLRGRVLFFRGPKARRGVWGAKPTSCFMGREISIPLLARPENLRPTNSDFIEQTKENSMNKLNSQSHLMTHKSSRASLLILVSLAFPIFTTACSTTCHKRNAIVNVFDGQSELIRRIKSERQSQQVSAKVQQDPALRSAETHLEQSLDALMDANSTLKSAL